MRVWKLTRVFLLLSLTFALSIFLHELGHHLLGVPSRLGLAKNYPLVPPSEANKTMEIIGTLAGPCVNVLLAYIGLVIYQSFGTKGVWRGFGCYLGVTNAFLGLSGAVVNLMVDLASRTRGNDLEFVSTLLGWNIFILPALVSALSLFPLVLFLRDLPKLRQRYGVFVLLFFSWLVSGGLLKLLDSLLQIRF